MESGAGRGSVVARAPSPLTSGVLQEGPGVVRRVNSLRYGNQTDVCRKVSPRKTGQNNK